jgi:hypothetical protein
MTYRLSKGSALVGGVLGIIQAHHFAPFENILMVVALLAICAFSAFHCVGRALLVAAVLLTMSRLPGLSTEIGVVIFVAGITVLCAMRRHINKLFPY